MKHVQRTPKRVRENKSETISAKKINVGIVASDTEFVCLTRNLLSDGPVNMTELHMAYTNILQKNGVHSQTVDRSMKDKLRAHIHDIHFVKPKCRNESEVVISTSLRDAAIDELMSQSIEEDIRQLFDSALILRRAIEEN